MKPTIPTAISMAKIMKMAVKNWNKAKDYISHKTQSNLV